MAMLLASNLIRYRGFPAVGGGWATGSTAMRGGSATQSTFHAAGCLHQPRKLCEAKHDVVQHEHSDVVG